MSGMGATAWDRQNVGEPQNVDRSRWYGLRPGDIVEMSYGQWKVQGRIIRLHSTDNNGCTIRVSGGGAARSREMKGVCEWCIIVKKVEDQ